MADTYDIIIIGAGPAGLTAAIYGARAGRTVLVIGGKSFGSQLLMTTEVEDIPGFPDPISGVTFIKNTKLQAERMGAKFLNDNVVSVNSKKQPFEIVTESSGTFIAKTVVIAVGAVHKWLGLKSEFKFKSRGIYTCAVCDGYFFKGKDVAVVGGGDSAMKDSVYLSNICKNVYVVHRRDKLRAQAALQERAFAKKNIKFIWNSEVIEFLGAGKQLEGIKIKNSKTGEESKLDVPGAFLSIGRVPATAFLKGALDLDEKGYIIMKGNTETSVPGIFAAGDAKDRKYQQAVVAAASGAMAALDADDFLSGFRAISDKARREKLKQ